MARVWSRRRVCLKQPKSSNDATPRQDIVKKKGKAKESDEQMAARWQLKAKMMKDKADRKKIIALLGNAEVISTCKNHLMACGLWTVGNNGNEPARKQQDSETKNKPKGDESESGGESSNTP